MRFLHFLFAASLAFIAGCASEPPAPDEAALVAEARTAAASLTQQLGGELKQAIGSVGPVGAIEVCKSRAPEIASRVGRETGLEIKRVSTRNRNPAGRADAWEQQALEQLGQKLAAGVAPEALETWSWTGSGSKRRFRYAKALPVQPLCVTCHGDPATMSPELRSAIAAAYPNDLATGFSVGMLRGIVSVRR
jgi:hypothetical protein